MSLNIDIEAHLIKKSLEETFEIFRILHDAYFYSSCDGIFDNPIDPNRCRYPIKNLVRNLMNVLQTDTGGLNGWTTSGPDWKEYIAGWTQLHSI